jgi:NDP-sugar pyrophosphorylase family protein
MQSKRESKILGANAENASVLLLSAGKGTRLGRITQNTPKVILDLPQIGSPLQYWYGSLNKLGFDKIAINLTYLADKVREFIKRHSLSIEIIYEPTMLGGLNSAKSFIKTRRPKDLILVYSDMIFEGSLDDAIQIWAPDSDPVGGILLTKTTRHGSFGYVKLGRSVEIFQKPSIPPANVDLIFSGIIHLNLSGLAFLTSLEDQTFDDGLVENFLVPNANRFEYWYLEGNAYDIGSVETLDLVKKIYATTC